MTFAGREEGKKFKTRFSHQVKGAFFSKKPFLSL
jgi:hypothetical protein